jgi:hypothetical protein
MLVALAGAFPVLLPYALAAYGGHSRLLAQVVESHPIACGDVFRRMAAKLLCARAGGDAAAFLANFGQLGVACESRMDGITHVARRYAAEFLRPGSGRCIPKVDVRNAFNTCSRSDFLHVVPPFFPHKIPKQETKKTNQKTTTQKPIKRARPHISKLSKNNAAVQGGIAARVPEAFGWLSSLSCELELCSAAIAGVLRVN